MNIINLLFISSFLFGYISLPGVPFDAQPWTLLISIVAAAFSYKRKFNPKISIILFSTLIIITYSIFTLQKNIFFHQYDLFQGIRTLVSLLTIPLVVLCCGMYCDKFVKKRTYMVVYYVWFFIATIQMFVNKYFLMSILPRLSTDISRGVVGLAPEPMEYAKIQLCFILVAITLNVRKIISTKELNRIIFLSSFQIISYSWSLTGYIYLLGFFFFYYAIRSKNFFQVVQRSFFLLIIPFGVIVFVGINFFPNVRAFLLIESLFNNFGYILLQGGFSARAFNIPDSILIGLYKTNLAGVGLAFGERIPFVVDYSFIGVSDYFRTLYIDSRAQGGLFEPVHIFGILGLFWSSCLVFSPFYLCKLYSPISIKRIFYVLIMTWILITIIEGSLSSPVYAFTYAFIFSTLINFRDVSYVRN
tara:strand:- start:532 stop:1779 length:1248 start_codon:yes stop_codon:yes gene_type:complete